LGHGEFPGVAPQYRDVIHEDAIKIGPHVKAPDYAFTIHGQRKFFLEAKKPSIDRLVYDLYGLTDKEIKLVEGASC
jgi:hypothetical protein